MATQDLADKQPSAALVPEEAPTPIDPADFVQGGEQVAKVDVRIAYGIIDRFSEGLYSSPNKAFEELVSNSYDAGAYSVWVYVPKAVKAGDVLAVIDDGASMDLAGLEALWEIGVSHKRDEGALAPDGRAPIGKFGIGKLATYVLGEKLTYVCRADGRYLAITMDYGKAKGGMSDPKPMSLHVVELSAENARETLETAIGDKEGVKALFGEKAPETWTVAILSDLKPKAESIQEGRLRWILRTGLPVGDRFKLWFNDDPLASPKEEGDRDWEFVVGETDAGLLDWPYADKVAKDDQGRPGVELEEAGFIRGRAELFTDHLTKGKSEGRGRSHGFFVKVRERLVNFDDESFGIDVELSHGVLARFRMEVFADGLDPHISSPRESIQDSPALEEVRNYLKSVFNRARTARAKKEEKGDSDLLAAANRIAAPPPALTTAPLRRVLKRAIESDDERIQSMMGLETDERREKASAALDDGETLLSEVVVESLTHEKPLVSYDVERRAVIVNSDHPFVSNYLDQHGAAEPLRLVGASEFLTQIYMLDEDMAPVLVHKILNRRDEFLRALVDIHPRSAVVIARQLRDSKENRHELEDAVADALELLGFEVTRISGSGKPDGIARARLGARGVGSGSTDYAVTYDSKSSTKDAIKAATTGTSALRKHRKSYEADYSLVVAPGFQGGDDEESSIAEYCTQDEVTPISVDDVARLVELFPFRALNPESLQGLFGCHLPKETAQYVQRIVEQDEVAAPPVAQILQITRDMSDRVDAVDVSAISTALRLEYKIELPMRQLDTMLRGLTSLAPDGLWYEEGRFALQASLKAVGAELATNIKTIGGDAAAPLAAAVKEVK
jgi:Histidine kinase-, DNA gyrase B-, and HSP90-like ATPase